MRQAYLAGEPLQMVGFSDSDWAGCPETRRSTGCILITVGTAVTAVTCNTQPGLPATSSSDAEIREMSHCARELIFQKQLCELDFELRVSIPELYADSAVGLAVSKKLGPGNKLRHLEICHMYVQEAERAKLLKTKKVKGTENPANFLTKHPKSARDIQEAMPTLAMISLDESYMQQTIAEAQQLKVSAIRHGTAAEIRTTQQRCPWKMPKIGTGGTLALGSLMQAMLARGADTPKSAAMTARTTRNMTEYFQPPAGLAF